MNDVVGLPGGGFAVSHMVTRGTGGAALFDAERARNDIGYVLTWDAAAGWRKLPGSDGALPNGLEISADGSVLYVNEYFAGGIETPFGGNRLSGFGREKGLEGLRAYCKVKSVAARIRAS